MKKYQPDSLISNAPLVHFRIIFGLMMAISLFRFYHKGWIEELYILPQYHFTWLGFDWVQAFSPFGMYALFAVCFIAALGIFVGCFYRLSCLTFFLSFTYIELIDKTNYLNHYYFVSLIAFLLLFLPAHRRFSFDAWRKPSLKSLQTERWTIDILKFQLALVYIFAGIAKLNPDWLFHAMPLKLWLPAQAHIPFIGDWLAHSWVPYLFSWTGAIYDLFIVFFLLQSNTRPFAYAAVVIFHLLTGLLFQIGMFPYIMIAATLLFFSPKSHEKVLQYFEKVISPKTRYPSSLKVTKNWRKARLAILFFVIIQLALPLRFLAYPGHLFWTEEGYRFSWRVMLMEKSGYAAFEVKDQTGKREWVNNRDYLSPQQEKMMSTQADMILQFAHFLKKEYEKKDFIKPQIYCKSRVSLNGKLGQTFIDPAVNLSLIERNFKTKTWILPYESQ